MAVTETQFRLDLPAFTSTTLYPKATIEFWLGIAAKLLIVNRWADLYDLGVEMFTAHQVLLETDKKDSGGPVSQRSAGDLSVSYDTTAGLELNAGHWNLTTYGKRFIQLARLCGTGGYQL